MEPSEQIEDYLLARGGWVPDIELAGRFGVSERQLRGLNGRPGLCSRFAISSDDGLMHVKCASTREWLRFKHRMRRHGINELRRVRDLERARNQVVRVTRAGICERDTGQFLLAGVGA